MKPPWKAKRCWDDLQFLQRDLLKAFLISRDPVISQNRLAYVKACVAAGVDLKDKTLYAGTVICRLAPGVSFDDVQKLVIGLQKKRQRSDGL